MKTTSPAIRKGRTAVELCAGTTASNHGGPSLFGLYASALAVNTNGLFPLTINLLHGIDLARFLFTPLECINGGSKRSCGIHDRPLVLPDAWP